MSTFGIFQNYEISKNRDLQKKFPITIFSYGVPGIPLPGNMPVETIEENYILDQQ